MDVRSRSPWESYFFLVTALISSGLPPSKTDEYQSNEMPGLNQPAEKQVDFVIDLNKYVTPNRGRYGAIIAREFVGRKSILIDPAVREA